SDRGGEVSSDLLRDFCRGEGILQSFTLPASPQQNGIAEHRICLVMEVARTSMIHAAAPHFLWPFAVWYAAHQLNLWPRVSLPETSPTRRWTREVGDASVFQVWGSRACFYHPTSRRVLPSQDVTFDESVPFYRLFPYRSAPPPPLPLFLAPGPPPVDPLSPQGPAPSGSARGTASGGAEPGGEELGGAEPEGVEPGGAYAAGDTGAVGVGATRLGGAGVTTRAGGTGGATAAGPGGARTGGTGATGIGGVGGVGAGGAGAGDLAEHRGAGFGGAGAGGTGAGGAGAGGAGAGGTGAGGAGAGGAGARDPAEPRGAGVGGAGVGGTGAGGAGAGGAGAGGTGAGGAGAGGAGAGDTGAVDPGAGGAVSGGTAAGGTVWPRPYFVPLLQQLASPMPAPTPYTEQIGGLPERREPASRPTSPVRTARRVPRPRPPPVPGTHAMALRTSSVPLRVPLPPLPESSLPEVPDPESDRAHAASPTVSRLLATVVTDPSFESTAMSALVAELLDLSAVCRLDYATALVAESESASPPSVGGECALGTDVLEDRQEDFECLAAVVPRFASMLLAPEGDPDAPDILTPRSYAEAITGPYSSQWQTPMDAEMASWKSTGTYVDAAPPSGANIVDGMWIFRVKQPLGSPPAFKVRYVARGFIQRQGVDYFQIFSPTSKMTTLRVLQHVAAQRDYELHSLDFSTAFLQGSLHEEIWLRRPPGFTGSFPAGTQWSLRRPVYGLRQVPREWHDTLRTALVALGFTPSTADPSLFLRTDTSLPPFYVLVYVDDLVFATADTEALTLVKSELQKRHTGTDLGELRSHLGLQITQDKARPTITLTQSHMVHQVLQRYGFQFSLPQPTPLSTGHSLLAPPLDESVEPSGPYPELVGCLIPAAAIVTMVDPVANAGVADTLEARLADARNRHADGEYGTIPLLIVELGIRSKWATEHPSRPDSPRPVRNEGGVDNEVDGGARVSGNNGTKQRGVLKVDAGVDRSQARVQKLTATAGSSCADVDGRARSPLLSSGGLSATTHVTTGGIAPTYGYFKFSPDRITVAPLQGRRDLITWRESIEPQLEVVGLKGFADGTVPIPPVDNVGLRGEFRAAHLLTFMVISRCCSPVVQLALRSYRERLDASHQAWHFILSTYQSATDYCNRARRILAEMQMAGAQYSTSSYISHIVKGLPRGYNLMKRMMMVPGTRESLDEDSITSYILQDEAMQEAEQPTELLPQANYAAPTKLNQQQGQRKMHGGGGSGGGRSTKDANEKRSMRGKGRGGDGRRRECWICHDPDHLSYKCPDRDDSVEDDTKGGRGRSTSSRPRRNEMPRREKQTSKKTPSTKDVDHSSGKSRGDGEASCSMVGLVEPTVSLAPEAGEDFQVVAVVVQANPMAVLLDSGCSHHLMGAKAVFVDMAPSGNVKHVRGFNGALQPVEGRGTIALQGEAGKRVLIPDVLYVLGVQANLLSAGQLKESGVQLKSDGDEMLLVAATRKVLGRARYTGRVLCTDLRPCPIQSHLTEVVALRTIVPATKSTPDRLHARLAHVSVDTIKSSAKHDVATGLDITPSTGTDPPYISCVGGKLALHTFPATGSNAAEALAVVHIDLCGPFRVAAKDGSLYFLLLKDRHTRFVWVMPIARKSDVPREFKKWLVLVERQTKKSVLMLRSDRGGEFLGKEFTEFVDGKGIVHDLTCPYTPQQNGMFEREMRTSVESVRTMLLHMGVQHHWWHLALRQAVWVRNCLERSTTPPGTTPYQLLTGKKPDLSLAWVWGCMVQFMVPEQQRGGKLVPKARWGLHLGVSMESKGWEILDLTNNKVVTLVEVIFYETLSLEAWKAKFETASGRTQPHPPTDTSTATIPLLVEVDEPADEDVVEVLPPSLVLAPPFLVAHRPTSTPVSTTGDEGSLEASAVVPASGIAGGRQGAKPVDQDGNPSTTGEQQTGEPVEQEASAGVHSTGELSKLAGGEESTDSDVVEVPITKPELRRTGRARRTPERLSFYACPPPAAFTAVYDEVGDDLLYDDAEEDDELPELDPDMHADPEHRWEITTMTVKEALTSWKGEAVKAAMEEEIRSLIRMGTWEVVKRPRGVNIMKNWWVLTTKYRLDDTVEREKARLVMKGFTQMCGADYDETYSPVSSYVTLRIFLSIVAVLDLNLMQLDMKNAFLQSKLDRVLYMHQPDHFDDGTGRVCKLLKSLYAQKQSPLLWYRALDGVLLGAGWKKSQVNEALYFKAGDDGVTCWVLVYVDDLLAASSSPAMLKELKELLEAAFELREISPVVKYLGLEIVRDMPARKLWLHQQGYANKLRRRFIDEEQGGRLPKTPVLVDAYAELTFDDDEAQGREEEEYRQKVGSLQFAATTTRPDIAFACSKLGSGLTVRSDQHWREVDRCLAYLADTRDTALEFGGGPESLELIGYVDADDAGDKQDRTSTGGYVFVYGGAAVSWSSSRIKCATLSSTESEYVAATNAGKEGRRLRFLLAEFKLLDAGKPTILRVDNKLAIMVAEGLGLTGNLKHMERRYAWLENMVRRGKFVLKYIPTTE
ncbi:unnamed protein product, partial [Closterium sp. NIES-54]